MTTWNKDSNISDDEMRVVKFTFVTNDGPGTVTAMVNSGVSIEDAKATLLDELDSLDLYQTIELTGYEIIEIIDMGNENHINNKRGPLH